MAKPPQTPNPVPEGSEYDKRPEFLIAMYNQLMSDINRHIVVVWQMVGVLAAAVAALVLAESNGVPIAYAVVVTVMVCAWAQEHIYDSNFWYNRNLVMITNIERVFLTREDLSLIHPYFGKHRSETSFLTHLKIQKNYTVIIVCAASIYFFLEAILPTIDLKHSIDWIKAVPFVFVAWFFYRGSSLQKFYSKKYKDYLKISPGLSVENDIIYGATHGD